MEINHLRPIDHLFMILTRLASTNRQEEEHVFEDFVSSYSMAEVCSMLIKIVSDKKATYNVASRVMESF